MFNSKNPNIFLSLVTTISLLGGVWVNVSASNNDKNNTHCGYIKFNHIETGNGSGTIVNIYKGVTLPQRQFESIYKKISVRGYVDATIKILIPGCNIEICGYPDKGSQRDYGRCYSNFNTEEEELSPSRYEDDFVISSISCGCEKPSMGNSDCQTRCSARKTPKDDVCGVLYLEDNCQDCTYDSIPLANNERLSTNNGIIVRSLLLRPGCTITQTSYGLSGYSYPAYNIQYDTNGVGSGLHAQNIISMSPSYTREGERYKCQCFGMITTTTTPRSSITTTIITTNSSINAPLSHTNDTISQCDNGIGIFYEIAFFLTDFL